jgi:hypothetical protein
MLIQNNNISGYRYGMNLDGGTGDAQSTVRENYVTGSSTSSIFIQGGVSNGHIITENVVEFNHGGIVVGQGENQITNNIVVNNTNPAIWVFDSGRTFGSIITGNVVHDNGWGILLGSSPNGSAPVSTAPHIVKSNSIVNNTAEGLRNDDTFVLVDGSGNWFGTTDPAMAAMEIGGLVDFTPMLANGNDVSSDPGFQGDFSKLVVHTLGIQIQNAGNERISEAIALVTDPGTIIINSGTYNDDLDATGKELTIAIGDGVGQVSVNNLTLNGDDTLEIEVNGLITPGTDFDQIVVNGTVNLGGATLVTSGTVSGLIAGDEVVLIANDGTDPVVGTFDGLANGAVVRINGETFRIFYNGGDGNDVVLVAGFQIIVTAPGPGTDGIVRVFDAFNQDLLFSFEPFPGFMGGVRVAVGDVNGDGTPDIITAAGPGGGPHVKVFDGTDGTTLLMSFFAFNPAFRGGVFVASGDVNGDDMADIIVGADAGGGPHVKVFSGASGAEFFSFFAFNPAFQGGVRVAAGDISGDGTPDIITAAGPGGSPHVRVFHGTTGLQVAGPLGSFFAYNPAFTGGVFVAAGDVNGDSRIDLITGPGLGGGPHVKVFDGSSGNQLAGPIGNFLAYDAAFTGGVRVAASDVNGDGMADVVTTPGPGRSPDLRIFDAASTTGPVVIRDALVEDPNFTGGIFVAAEIDQLFADGDSLTNILG